MTDQEKTQYMTRVTSHHQLIPGFSEKYGPSEWARRLGLSRTSLWRYLKKGLTIEEIAEVRGIKYK